MRITLKPVAALMLPVFLAAAPAFAQQRVVDPAVLQQALSDKAASQDAQRAQVRRVLDRDDVRQMAGRMGLDIGRASQAVGTLSGGELNEAAQHAGSVEAALAGGATVIAISLTTLLLILIIVILLAQ